MSTARCSSIRPSSPVREPGVVAGRDRVEAERQRAVEHGGELDLLVAAQAGVGGAAGGVLGHEVLDDVLVEAVAQVPDVEGDPDHVGSPAGVVRRPRSCSSRGRRCGRTAGCARGRGGCPVTSWPASAARAAATAESTPPDMAARTRSGIAQPTLRDEPPIPATTPAARARSTTGPIASTRASTSAAVVVWPREKRSETAGLLVVAAHRQQHVGGLGHAGRARRAGGAGDPAGVEQHQQRVALAAGEGQVRVAGQPVVGVAVGVAVDAGVGHLLDAPARPGRCAARRSARPARPGACTASSTAAAKPAMAGVSMVPERTSRSCPPPCSCGVSSSSRRTTSAPTP